MDENILKTAESLGIAIANKTEEQLRAEIAQRQASSQTSPSAPPQQPRDPQQTPENSGSDSTIVDRLTQRYLDVLDSADISAQRENARRNPEFAKYSGQTAIGMSDADKDKLEAQAAQAGLSVEEYTGLSGLDRYRARNGEAPRDATVGANGNRSVAETRTVAQVEAAERVRGMYAEQQSAGSGSLAYPTAPMGGSNTDPSPQSGASQLAFEGNKSSGTIQVSAERSDRYNSQGYAGSTFTGSEINNTARQLPGGTTISPFAERVVTDPNGRVVGSSTSNPAARIVSQLAGIPPVGGADAAPRSAGAQPASAASTSTAPPPSPFAAGTTTLPNGRVGSAYLNPEVTRSRAAQNAQSERSAIARSLAISEFNRGESDAQRAFTSASAALAPGGASTASVDYNTVRDKVNKSLATKPNAALPKATQDRFNERVQALPGQLEKREREQRIARRLASR